MTNNNGRQTLRPPSYSGYYSAETIVDGIVDPVEPSKDARLLGLDIENPVIEFRGGGTDHLDVDTSVHVRHTTPRPRQKKGSTR